MTACPVCKQHIRQPLFPVTSTVLRCLCKHGRQCPVVSFDQPICLGVVGRCIHFVQTQQCLYFFEGTASVGEDFSGYPMATNDLFHQQSFNGGCRLVRYWKDLWPLGQVIHKYYCILVPCVGSLELNHIHPYTVKWSRKWYWSQRGSSWCSPTTVCGANKAGSAPPRDIGTHPTPPVVFVELSMHFCVTKVASKLSPVSLLEQL